MIVIYVAGGIVAAGALFWGGQVLWLAFCVITMRDYPSGRKFSPDEIAAGRRSASVPLDAASQEEVPISGGVLGSSPDRDRGGNDGDA